MTDQNHTAPAARPLSDEYVNAVIQKYGYQSIEAVGARLYQWIGLHGGENGLTLLIYEAHKALSALRAPVAGEAQPVAWRALWTLPTPGATAWRDTRNVAPPDEAEMRAKGYSLELAFAAPQASKAVRILFPSYLRKMWSGGEVQAWLDNYQGITPPTASAKGSLERYRNWRAEQAEADKDGVRSKGRQ
ncbi:hypothetical protein [Achromobacter sp. JUb104]|uniref:hypothetical protein n=1 Tax=Achromobacter sp. JUb104 TaxID=2940590 RepID=UPI00216A32B5|nr:hypothetical protein [Achromobacter sp. JUb104]MCS3504975.1 hypothetical protein [Achromobacter sp. JUb104]